MSMTTMMPSPYRTPAVVVQERREPVLERATWFWRRVRDHLLRNEELRWNSREATKMVRRMAMELVMNESFARPYLPGQGRKKPRGPRNKAQQRLIRQRHERAVEGIVHVWQRDKHEIMRFDERN